MAQSTYLRLIPLTVLPGRNCAPNPLQGANATGTCCIPCPVYDYLYKDGMTSTYSYINCIQG